MSLAKRTVAVPIGGGVDEATIDVAFEAPLVREAVNSRFEKAGSVAKRFGETALSATLPDTTTYGQHSTIAEHDARAVVLTQLGAYMHDPAKDVWASAGAVSPRPSQAKTDSLIRQNNSSAEPEIALVTVSGKTLACVVWSDTDIYECFYCWFEVPADGSPLRVLSGPSQFGTSRLTCLNPRLAVIGTTVYMVAGDALAVTNIYYARCDAASTYTFSILGGAAGWALTAVPVALLTNGTDALWSVQNESAGGYSIRKLDTSFTETANQVVAGASALDAIRSSSTIVVIKCGATADLDDCADDLAAPPTNHPLLTVGATDPLFVAAVRATLCAAASGGFFCAWERANDAGVELVKRCGVVIASVTSGYALTISGVVGSVRLAGRAAYRSGEALPLLPVLDVINTTYYRCGYIGRPATDTAGLYTLAEVCRFGQDIAAYQDTSRSFEIASAITAHAGTPLPSMIFDSASGQWVMAHRVVSDASVTYNDNIRYGIDALRLDISDAAPLRNVSAQAIRLFGGGAGVSYTDGPVHAELTPPPISLIDAPDSTSDASGIFYVGAAAEVTIYVTLAARWRDERGNLHRGAPLLAFGICGYDNDADPDDEARRIRFPRPFPATIRGEKGGQAYEVEVYAGATAAGPHYLFDVVTPKAHPTYLGIDYILISQVNGGHGISARGTAPDHIADVLSAATGPYPERWTDTGELVHVPPPATLDVCSTQSRVWALSAENGRRDLFPSKLLTPGYAPEFPTALRIVLPDEGGEATAIAALNDKIAVFKERLVYVVFGDPGDNTGAGGTIQSPRLVQGDVGCANAQSVVEGPFGVAFRSKTGGFHVLGPDLSVRHLPALEDSLADYVCTSAVLVADKKEVRWSLTDGAGTLLRTLTWDYERDAWCTRTDVLETVHACTVGGAYTRMARGGSVLVSRDAFSTSLDVHEQKITSAWVKLAGLQGFKRVWKSVFLLRWYSGDVIVRIGVDYEPGFTDERTFTSTELAALDESDGTVQIEVQHTRQKCEAVRFQIEEDNPGGQTPPPRGAGFTLMGVQLECGIKKGSYSRAMPAAARK